MSTSREKPNSTSERQRQAMQALTELIPKILSDWDLGLYGYTAIDKGYEWLLLVKIVHEDNRREYALCSGESFEGACLRFLGMLRAGHVNWREDAFQDTKKG